MVLKKIWDWIKNKFTRHIQGIAQAGNEYIVLSSTIKQKDLILYYDEKKKVVQIERLPKGYEHAGGLGVLNIKSGKNGENEWMIAVPVYKVGRGQDDKGAILRYFLSDEKGDKARLTDCEEIISLPTKAYAAGIARNGNSVVIAVIIDDKGNKVQLWKCNKSNGQGTYSELSVWDAEQAEHEGWINKKNGWIDENWARYPNSISLIEHGGQIYFVGLNGPPNGDGDNWVDIYSVDLFKNNQNNRQLIKVGKAKTHLSPVRSPSFRWGGSAGIHKGILEVLAVGFEIKKNNSFRYKRFCFNIHLTVKLTLT